MQLPPDVWKQICVYLEAEKTGRISIDVSNGRVRRIYFDRMGANNDCTVSVGPKLYRAGG